MIILGVETSCDETSLALVENGSRVLGHALFSSVKEHKKFGGVVPEVACRAHAESILFLLDELFRESSLRLSDIDAVAVTRGPGLAGALLVGLSLAKTLSFALSKPLVGVNHLKAHLYTGLMGKRFKPSVGLVVSGGHTSLLYMKDRMEFELLGRTTDDAAGEAYDKVAKVLNLGYPGGPAIDKLSAEGHPDKMRFPRAKVKNRFNFSFSGIKTAVLYYVRDNRDLIDKGVITTADICASFQAAMIDMLVDTTVRAVKYKKVQRLVLGGGVSANAGLRAALKGEKQLQGIEIIFPQTSLCTDNAIMVAAYGFHLYERGLVSDLHLTAEPTLAF